MKKKVLASLMAATMLVGMTPMQISAKEPEKENPVMAEIYVSPNGNANAQGTEADPLDSMESARLKVETMNQDMTGDIVVYFEDGEYLVRDTVAFMPEDSGSNGYNVIYKAKEGANPVFTGGVPVTNWSNANDANHPEMVVADVNIDNTRQLYVDGELATRAKGNISGNMQRAGEKFTYTTYNGNHDAYTGFSVDNTEIQSWRNPGDIEFVWDISWAHRIAVVESITPQDDNHSFIKMKWDAFKMGQIAGGVQITGAPNYVENAYELMDEPGEWYFDRSAKKLYYMPEKNQDMNASEVIIPGVEEIITVTGDRDTKAGNLSFEGLQFEYNTWLVPSEMGWPEQQANFAHDPKEDFNMHAYSLAPGAAIETKYAENVVFDKCVFQNLGSAAINMQEGTVNNTISNSVFKGISAGGVMIGGTDITDAHPLKPGDTVENHIANGTAHDEAQFVKDNTITNNYFNKIGTEYKGSIAVWAGYTDHTVITNNTIRDVAYSGISVGWGWGYWDQNGRYIDDNTPDEETPKEYPRFPKGDAAESKNNVIERNDVSQCMMKLHDGAGVYTLGDMPNSSIAGNVVHDNTGWPGGIYLDQGSGGMTLENNITYNTQMTLFDNVREYTWGHRYNPPIYKDKTNYWNVSPDMENYPAELAAKAGVQNDDIIPKELNRVTAPEFVKSGDRIVLEGNFGEKPGKVVLTGEEGSVEVTQESGNILSWTTKQIVFRMPGGVKSGKLYVETSDGDQTNKNHKLTVGGFTEELFSDDFEGYESGNLLGQEIAAENYTEISDKAVIEPTEEGSKVLKLVTDGGNTAVAKAADWKDVMVSVDFKFDSEPQSWYRTMVVSPRYVDGNNTIESAFTSYGSGILMDQRVNGNLSRKEAKYSYQTGVWYSAKVAMVGNDLKVKIWEKEKAEPTLWTGSANHSEIKQGGLQLYFVDVGRNSEDTSAAEVDNLRVMQYEEGVTSDLSYDKTAPVVSATLSGMQKEKGVYESEVELSLDAQDEEAGVAEIEYSLNGGTFEDYTEPLKFTKNGEYEIVYRSADRAGNTAAEKKICFTIALMDASKVLYEDNFDSYTEGGFADQNSEYTLENGHGVEIVTDEEGNKLLRLNSQGFGTDVNVIKSGTWDNIDTVMTFDMMYKKNARDYGGASVSNYYQNKDNKYSYIFAPNWGGVLFQQRVGGNADNETMSNDTYRVEADTWYHVKVRTSENMMALKVWPKGTEEPAEWIHQRQPSGLTGPGGLELSFMDDAGNYVDYDNIQILGFESVETDTTHVTFITEPKDAKVILKDAEGNTVKAQEDESYQLAAGTYQYMVSAKGYVDVVGTLNVQGEAGKDIYITLNKEKVETDRKELDKTIEEALAIENLEQYTEESVERFQTALANALNLDENATQDDIDKAAKELKDAMSGLTLKGDDNQGGDNQGGDNQGGDNQGGNSQGTNDTDGKGSSSQNDNSVKTGDTMNWIPIIGVIISVGAILTVVVLKTRKSKNNRNR